MPASGMTRGHVSTNQILDPGSSRTWTWSRSLNLSRLRAKSRSKVEISWAQEQGKLELISGQIRLNCQRLPEQWHTEDEGIEPVGQRPRSPHDCKCFLVFYNQCFDLCPPQFLRGSVGSELALCNCFVSRLQVRFIEVTCGRLRWTVGYSALKMRGHVSRDLMRNLAWGVVSRPVSCKSVLCPPWFYAGQFQLSSD